MNIIISCSCGHHCIRSLSGVWLGRLIWEWLGVFGLPSWLECSEMRVGSVESCFYIFGKF